MSDISIKYTWAVLDINPENGVVYVEYIPQDEFSHLTTHQILVRFQIGSDEGTVTNGIIHSAPRHKWLNEYIGVPDLSGLLTTLGTHSTGVEVADIELKPSVIEPQSVTDVTNIQYSNWKKKRAKQAQDLTVMVRGMEFKANDLSQLRMSNKLQAMKANSEDECTWILKDKTQATVTRADLAEAITQADAAMTNLWLPNPEMQNKAVQNA